ncbi:MAG: cell division protein FtsQ [Paludibacteraceae bacterium]|nr:cell division protein FtsQ [Paludibacteraceae bacterium]
MNEKTKMTIKRIATGVAFTVTVAYMLFAIIRFNYDRDNSLCMGLNVTIKDSADIQFIHKGDVQNFINEYEPELHGKNMNLLNTTELERKLTKHLVAIKNIECYKTPDCKLQINIWQRHPILRITKNTGLDYYIDADGCLMPIPSMEPAYVPIASGEIRDSFATGTLYKFAKFLNGDHFWDSQIEQIYVKHNGEVRLVPRVGHHIIEMGKLDNFEEKLDKLEKVYSEAFPEKGWNQYSVINLKFDNQVICTKK